MSHIPHCWKSHVVAHLYFSDAGLSIMVMAIIPHKCLCQNVEAQLVLHFVTGVPDGMCTVLKTD